MTAKILSKTMMCLFFKISPKEITLNIRFILCTVSLKVFKTCLMRKFGYMHSVNYYYGQVKNDIYESY